MNRFKTIQEIEVLDLSSLSRPQLRELKNDLNIAFYHTSHKDLSTDGRKLKELLGKEHTRVTDYIMSLV